MKISIIGGAGTLGATSAFVLAQQDLAEEICLIDVKGNLAKSHEMDMGQAVAAISQTKIRSGGLEQLEGSDIVLLCAGMPETQIQSRMELLNDNLQIIRRLLGELHRHASRSILITMTNPVDVINSILHQYGLFDSRRLIGFSLNDSHRFRWAISQVLKVDMTSVQAMVIGEHGEAQVPLYSSITVDGKKVELKKAEKEIVGQTISGWFQQYQQLNAGRTSGWLSAVSISRLVTAIVKETGEMLPCSVINDQGISIGQPVLLGKDGVQKVVDIHLNDEERFMYDAAASKLSNIVKSVVK